MAKWLIGGAALTLALALILLPLKPQEVPPKGIDSWGEATAAPGRAATRGAPDAQTGGLKSSAILETLWRMQILPMQARFLLTPLTHPKPVLLLPGATWQINDLLPLTGRHNQLQAKDLSGRLLANAGSYLNTPYRRGGSLQTGPGTDCSGFVQYIYKQFNVNLPRSSSEQAQVGKVAARTMDFAQMIPADLLFFSRGGRHIGHVGIYLGAGKMIHASNSCRGVIITDLRQAYFAGTFVVAKRILKDKYYQ